MALLLLPQGRLWRWPIPERDEMEPDPNRMAERNPSFVRNQTES